MSSSFALHRFILLALVAGVHAQKVIYEIKSAKATFYYDLTNKLCDYSAGGPNPPNWGQVSGINNGKPKCESRATAETARSLAKIGTNRIVAMDPSLLMTDGGLDYWCGKEVTVWDSAGKEIKLDDGPFVLWDACAACGTTMIDLSAQAFVKVKGGSCAGNNPTGLKVQVLDRNVWPALGGSGSAGSAPVPPPVAPTSVASVLSPAPGVAPSPAAAPSTDTKSGANAGSKDVLSAALGDAGLQNKAVANAGEKPVPVVGALSSSTTTVTNTPTVTSTIIDSSSPGIPAPTPSVEPASPAPENPAPAPEPVAPAPPSAAPAASSIAADSCTFGKWQCSGLNLEICNYVSPTSLGWETIEKCKAKCSITSSGSVDCE